MGKGFVNLLYHAGKDISHGLPRPKASSNNNTLSTHKGTLSSFQTQLRLQDGIQ